MNAIKNWWNNTDTIWTRIANLGDEDFESAEDKKCISNGEMILITIGTIVFILMTGINL